MDIENFKIPGFTVSSVDFPELFAHGLCFTLDTGKFRTILKYDQSVINEASLIKYCEQIKTLAYNKISFPSEPFRSTIDLITYLDNTFPAISPDEVVNLILDFIYSKLSSVGQYIELNNTEISQNQLWRNFYLKNQAEFQFFLEYLKDENLIKYLRTKDGFSSLTLTIDGVRRINNSKSPSKSNYCFVAMSFDENLLASAYELAIKPALKQTGFIPIILTEQHVDSEQTINDAILSGIKKAHFTIADFTQHRNGVYFEAGYALGRGQKVIYTCSNEDIGNAHFDTRNFQHIVWTDANDLLTRLVAKIEAFIKE